MPQNLGPDARDATASALRIPNNSPGLPLERSLDLLACPACLEPFRLAPEAVVCTACGREYPLLDGIPILLIDRASRAIE